MLYIRMILTLLVSLYTSRVVLNTLGIEDYGIYNVIGGVVTMFGFFNAAMASSTQRFFSFDLGRNDNLQLRKTFNATQIIHMGIAFLILILAETIGLWFINHYLNIPDERMEAVRWVYHFSVASFIISIIQVPYNSLLIARERMNIYAYVSILEVSLRLLVVFALTWVTFDKLKLYGMLLCGVSLIVAAIYRIYSLIHFKETRFEFVKDRAMYKTLISYSGWNLFGSIAAVARGQGVSIILNFYFGAVVNAAQGIANQVFAALNSFIISFQLASNPQIIKSYAAEEKEYMSSLIVSTAKFSFYLLFVLTLPVLLEIEYILKLWLKVVPGYTAIFTVLILLNALIDTVSVPLMTSLLATGKIKVYQSVVGILLILILPVTHFFFKSGFPPESTFLVSISVSVSVLAVRLILIKRQIPEFAVSIFLKEVIIRNFPVVLFSMIVPLLVRINLATGLPRLIAVSLVSLVSSIFVIYFIGLKHSEKMFVKNEFSVLFQKLRNEE